MMPGMNPKNMKKIMQSMGIKHEDLQAELVTITLSDKELLIHGPQVMKVTMAGQVTFQVVGTIEERPRLPEITEEDIEAVLGQVDASEDEAREALLNSGGDIAKAILDLQKSHRAA